MKSLKVFIFVGAALFLTGCYHAATTRQDAAPPPAAEEGVTAMNAFNFGFSPSSLNAVVGQGTSLNITSDGTHTFTVDELSVNQPLSKGTNNVTFTPNRSGTFSYYCAIPGHRERGMVGSLSVQ